MGNRCTGAGVIRSLEQLESSCKPRSHILSYWFLISSMIFFFLFKWDDALQHSTCSVLEAPIFMTLAPGRIEWSFRLSVAVWPLCPFAERRHVCDNTGLYRCSDGCLWSRSWQRRRELKRGEGRDGRLLGLSGLQERKTSFILGTVPFEGCILCHLKNILSSSPNAAWTMFISDIYSFLLLTTL